MRPYIDLFYTARDRAQLNDIRAVARRPALDIFWWHRFVADLAHQLIAIAFVHLPRQGPSTTVDALFQWDSMGVEDWEGAAHRATSPAPTGSTGFLNSETL